MKGEGLNPFSRVNPPPKPDDLLSRAFRRAFSRGRGLGGSLVARARAREIQRIRSMVQSVSDRLILTVRSFPNLDNVTPFYLELAGSLVNIDELRHSLGALYWAAKTIRVVGRRHVVLVRRAKNPREMELARRGAMGRISSIVRDVKGEIIFVREAAFALRKLPSIDVDRPSLIVAGPPNAGKSTLVRRISSGSPEVAPYPFTTKGLLLGHLNLPRVGTVQVIDTPGLLDRPLSERNKLELQAILAIRHLRGVVLMLLDPTETCGMEVRSQLSLAEEILKTFPEKKFLFGLNKSDLGILFNQRSPIIKEAISKLGFTPIEISAETGEGIPGLLAAVREALLG